MKTFGQRLAATRKGASLSQEALAREVGVAVMSISRYERDAMGIEEDVLGRLAARLGKSVAWFRYGDPAETVDTSTADDVPTDQDEDIARVVAEVGLDDDGARALRSIRRSAGRMPIGLLYQTAETIKANRATDGAAFPKGADKSEATTRGETGLRKTSLKRG